MNTGTCKAMLRTARARARTEVLCFDGAYNGLLNVLYQVPWGNRVDAQEGKSLDAKFTIGTLLCPDGVLDCCCGRT